MNVFVTKPTKTKRGTIISISLNDEQLKKYKIESFEKKGKSIFILLGEQK